jgi:PKD repeat protein
MKALISSVVALLFIVFSSGAQVGHAGHAENVQPSTVDDDALACGFIATQQQLDQLENNQDYQQEKDKFIQEFGQRALTQIDWVPIKAHIARTSGGSGGLTVIELSDALDNMNLYYINANMQFYLCDGINYIDDDTYYDFDASDEAALHAAHGITNLINIYFCNSVGSGSSAYCGYAYYPGGTDLIMMDNSCALNGSTLSHEMGHFYSLRHTHGGSNGNLTSELVNGSNCATDGDFVCDTEADPQLGNSNVNVSCIYDGSAPYTSGGGVDANGDQFAPNPNNIMSYSRKSCRDFFSVGQFARIYAAHSSSRNYFTCPTYNVDFSATPISACSTPITVNFTDNSVGATSWEWDVDGDNVVDYTTQNPTHVYSVDGSYDVRLTISDGSTDIAATKTSYISIGALETIPYNEDYETFTAATNATGLMKGWTTNPENTTSDYRWNVDVDGTPSNGTGPLVDNTLGTTAGHYMHTEATSGATGDVAELVSACIDLNVGAPELSFAYHMHGTSVGQLHLDIYAGGVWTNDIMPMLNGEQTFFQTDPYSNQTVDLTAWAGQVIQLRFRAVRAVSWAGDMAIDDIDIQCVAPTPVADFTAASTTPCHGGAVLFSDASTDAVDWLWDFGAGATPATATGAGPHSVVYSSAGSKTITLTTTGGCSTDIITKTNYLTVDAAAAGAETVTICDSYTSPSANYTWTSTGTYNDTIPNALGCDSVLTVNLTITTSTAATDPQSACATYTWIDGNTYTSTNNTANHTLTNAAGCDSVITLDLTISYPNTGTDVLFACGSYAWIDGNTYTATNMSATHNLTNVAGCDSVVTLNLTIGSSNSSTAVLTACDSYSWIDGNTYTSTNNAATHTLTNVFGCDSVVTLNLTITNSSASTDVISACNAHVWLDGTTYTASNNAATHILTNAAGCDSVVTLNLTILNSSASTDVISACNLYVWTDGNTYTSNTNAATQTFTNSVGCDSVVTLDLTITTIDITLANASPTLTSNQASSSYQWLDCDAGFMLIPGETGQSFTATANGNYSVEITNAGCVDTSACENITGIRIEELSNDFGVIIYPNPADELVNISFDELPTDNTSLHIYDMSGREVYFINKITSKTLTVDLTGLSVGIYSLRFMNANTSVVLRLVKE